MTKLRPLILIPALGFIMGVIFFLTHIDRISSKPAPAALAKVMFVTPTPIFTLEPKVVVSIIPADIVPSTKTPIPESTPTTRPTRTPTASPTYEPAVIVPKASASPIPPNEPAEAIKITFTGTGDDIQRFTLENGGGLAELSLQHQGDSNFIVQLLDHNGKLLEIFAYAVGEYNGKSTANLTPEAYALDVVADGNWLIDLTVAGAITQPDQPEAKIAELPPLAATPAPAPSP